MKNALLLVSIWVGIILVAYAMVYWDWGIEQPLPISVLEPASSTYVDPNGRFSLAVPLAWDVEETETSVLLTDPSDEIEVTVSVVEETVPESALLVALGIVGVDGAPEEFAVEEISPVGASERAVRIALPSADGSARYGLAYLYEGETVVLLVRGGEEALRDRAADLELIEAGIAVPAAAVEETGGAGEAEPVVEL